MKLTGRSNQSQQISERKQMFQSKIVIETSNE